MQNFDATRYNSSVIRDHALKFDTKIFIEQIDAFIGQAWSAHETKKPFVWHDPIHSVEG